MIAPVPNKARFQNIVVGGANEAYDAMVIDQADKPTHQCVRSVGITRS